MSEEEVPIIIGHAGLLGRQQIPRQPEHLEEPEGFDEHGDPVWPVERVALAMPSGCMRKLALPGRIGGREVQCETFCRGRQDDGGCLAEMIRQAKIDGEPYKLEVSYDEYGEQHWAFAREA